MSELVVKENDVVMIEQSALAKICNLLDQEKAIKLEKDNLMKSLQEQMEKYGVTQIKNDYMTISYTGEHTAERFDSKSLKEQAPALYDSYCKETKVKASVRITPRKA